MKIDQFMAYIEARTQSRNTLRAYRSSLERFAAYLDQEKLSADQVRRQTISGYINVMQRNRGRTREGQLSAATINRHLSVISQYYRWLQGEEEGRISNPVSLIHRPKVRNKKPRAVEEPILQALNKGIGSYRDKALILVLLYSGLRIDELRRLNRDSISAIRHVRRNGMIEFFGIGEVLGKGNKKRGFIVGPAGMKALKEYLINSRSADSLKPLFISSRKSRLSCRSMQHILGKWCQRLGLPHSHPHQLRHSFATRNVNAGMSLVVLQELLGHESLETLQRYYKIHGTRIKQEFFAAMEYVPRFSPGRSIPTRRKRA